VILRIYDNRRRDHEEHIAIFDAICRRDTDGAAELMRQVAVRRLPVVESERLIGMISLGDLAIEQDSDSALADISGADPNS